MGKLIEGLWMTDDKLAEIEARKYDRAAGKFQRGSAKFRNWITVNGQAGPTGEAGFKAETGRYHLFAALNCPWAHRTLIYRKIKKLEAIVSLSLAAPARTEQGWVFSTSDKRFRDELYQLTAMHELYTRAVGDYTGRVTVPVLWDKQTQTIVSNESADIIRMFNSAFNEITGDRQDFYPASLSGQIDELNDFIFNNINNGVYKSGFARTQAAYDDAVTKLFTALDILEQRLGQSRYLFGENITEADWRLLPTLVRFDVAYYSAFKCNWRAIRDYPHLSTYLTSLYQQQGIAETVDLDIYRKGYHSKSPLRNPHGIVPIGFQNVFA